MNLVTNSQIETRLQLASGWIEPRTGIRQRYYASPDQHTVDLAAGAAGAALEDADVSPADLDLTICATMTPGMVCPAVACRVVERIGAIPCGGFDLNIACTGYVAALGQAHAMVAAGLHRSVLVVAADIITRIIDHDDPKVVGLFGDAAAAAVVVAGEPGRGCLIHRLGSDGRLWPILYQPSCPAEVPPGHEPPEVWGRLRLHGSSVFRAAVESLMAEIPRSLDLAGLTIADVDWFVFHQSNLRMIDHIIGELGIPREKCPITIDRYGNTSAASMGIAWHHLRQSQRVRPGDRVMFAAAGGGMSWGIGIWRV